MTGGSGTRIWATANTASDVRQQWYAGKCFSKDVAHLQDLWRSQRFPLPNAGFCAGMDVQCLGVLGSAGWSATRAKRCEKATNRFLHGFAGMIALSLPPSMINTLSICVKARLAAGVLSVRVVHNNGFAVCAAVVRLLETCKAPHMKHFEKLLTARVSLRKGEVRPRSSRYSSHWTNYECERKDSKWLTRMVAATSALNKTFSWRE